MTYFFSLQRPHLYNDQLVAIGHYKKVELYMFVVLQKEKAEEEKQARENESSEQKMEVVPSESEVNAPIVYSI